jgi:hypothetical protein
MLEDLLKAKRCKANLGDSFFERQIQSMQFYCKTQKYEPLHNSQDEVSRQEDVPLRKDASSTNSIQKDFPMQKDVKQFGKILSLRDKFQVCNSTVKHKNANLCITLRIKFQGR